MEQPWAEYPKSSLDRVTDCFAHAPGILERVKTLPFWSANQQLSLLYKLVHECWQVDQHLDIIHDEMQKSTSGRLYWPIPSQRRVLTHDDDSLADLFPVALCFSDIQTARTLTLLWATRTMLWTGLCNLYSYAKLLAAGSCSSIHDESGLHPLGYREDYISMACHVCQSVEYFLQNEMLLAGPMSVSPALGIVLDSLQQGNHPREVAWLRAALDLVRQKGLRALEYVI